MNGLLIGCVETSFKKKWTEEKNKLLLIDRRDEIMSIPVW